MKKLLCNTLVCLSLAAFGAPALAGGVYIPDTAPSDPDQGAIVAVDTAAGY